METNRFFKVLEVWENFPGSEVGQNAWVDFFRGAGEEEKIYALALLTGKAGRIRAFSLGQLREIIIKQRGISKSLFDDCLLASGDLSETVSLLAAGISRREDLAWNLSFVVSELGRLRRLPTEEKEEFVLRSWTSVHPDHTPWVTRILSGSFRSPLKKTELVDFISKALGFPAMEVARRLESVWKPENTLFQTLFRPLSYASSGLRLPLPFAKPVQLADSELPEEMSDWHAEWAPEGISCHLVVVYGSVEIWTREGELVSSRFPELIREAASLPADTVLEGLVVEAKTESSTKYRASGLKSRTDAKSTLRNRIFLVSDLLFHLGEDLRHHPYLERRQILEKAVTSIKSTTLFLSEGVGSSELSRILMERKNGRYSGGKNLIFRHKRAGLLPQTQFDLFFLPPVRQWTLLVLLNVRLSGTGKGKSISGASFGARISGSDGWVPVANMEGEGFFPDEPVLLEFIRTFPGERFGPVQTLPPVRVYRMGFSCVERSSRHKAGLRLSGVSVEEWATEKSVSDVVLISELLSLL